MARKWGAFFRQFYSFLKRVKTYLIWSLLGLLLAGITPVSILAHSAHPTQVSQLPNISQQGSELVERGREFYETGDYQNAVTALTQARDLYRQQGKVLNEAIASSYLSLVYQKIGDWQAAERSILSSLEAVPLTGGTDAERQTRALALNTKGQYQLQVGQAESAFETWEQAEQDYASVNDTKGILGTQINQALALEQMGHYRRSCNSLLKGLGVPGKTCDRLPKGEAELKEFVAEFEAIENLELRALGLRSLGNALRAIGQLEASEWVLNESLEVSKRLGLTSNNLLVAGLLSLANTQSAIAQRQQDYGEEFEEYLFESQKNYQQAKKLSKSPQLSLLSILNPISILQHLQPSKDWLAEKQAILFEAEQKIKILPESRFKAIAQLKLADVLLNSYKISKVNLEDSVFQNSRELIEAAVQQSENLDDRDLLARSLGTLGQYYQILSNSQTNQELSSKLLEKAVMITHDALNHSNKAEVRYSLEWQMGRLLQATEFDRAIEYYQSAIQTLQQVRGDLIAVDPQIQFSFRENIEPVYREIVNLILPADLPNPSQEKLKEAIYYIDSLQVSELENYLRCGLSGEFLLQKNSENNKFNGTIAQVRKITQNYHNSALFYTIVLSDRLLSIVYIPEEDRLLYHSSNIDKDLLEKSLNSINGIITRPSFPIPEELQSSKKLYELIVKPYEEILKTTGVKTLLFVLDGQLQKISMAALYDGENYLVEKYATAVIPSIQLVREAEFSRDAKALILGATKDRPNFSSLTTQDQIDLLKPLLENPEILSGKNFTQQRLEQEIELNTYNLIHLITHGQFHSNPDKTYILTDDESENIDEYSININEWGDLFQNRLSRNPINLIVFSACETATSDRRATLGIAGLAVRSGAIGTIATLWKADQKQTMLFFERFYEYLLASNGAIDKAEALRLTQVDFINGNNTSDTSVIPYYWAPFILVGY
jgi:CHAT domain-containing protein